MIQHISVVLREPDGSVNPDVDQDAVIKKFLSDAGPTATDLKVQVVPTEGKGQKMHLFVEVPDPHLVYPKIDMQGLHR